MDKNSKRIAIFASGSGSNAESIIKFFQKNSDVASVVLVITNNLNAGVIQRAKELRIPSEIFNARDKADWDWINGLISDSGCDLIVLAGFMSLIPPKFVSKFAGRIVNIHPSLLPKYGGKGMYGLHVHEAVLKAGEKETGITVHYVDANYDEGEIIFQAVLNITKPYKPVELQEEIKKMEHQYYPLVIERLLR